MTARHLVCQDRPEIKERDKTMAQYGTRQFAIGDEVVVDDFIHGVQPGDRFTIIDRFDGCDQEFFVVRRQSDGQQLEVPALCLE
jgi:hypothetical protein